MSTKPKRKALLVGSNYKLNERKLNGCISSINAMKTYLQNSVGLTSCLVVSDESNIKPTRANILREFKKFIMDSKEGDKLWFVFSGHGTQDVDKSGVETDGLNECICSYEADTSIQVITDDEIKQILVNLHPKASLFAVFDCCHSGTMMDLKYQYQYNGKLLVSTNEQMKNAGQIVMLSGCKDNQTSLGVQINNVWGTSLINGFLKSCNQPGNITINEMLTRTRDNLKAYTQMPQLSSNHLLNLGDLFFLRF